MNAQFISFSFTGSGTLGQGGAIGGQGSGTLFPGGASTISIQGSSSLNDPCAPALQLLLNFTPEAGGALNLRYTAQLPLTPGAMNTTGTLVVTGGAGPFQDKGGRGPGTFIAQFQSQTAFTYTFTANLSIGGPLFAVPVVNPGGIVPLFSDLSAIQSGSWISIYGAALSNERAVWNADFPTLLGNVSVTIASRPAYLWLVSPGQINAQAPDDTIKGCVSVVVSTPNGTIVTAVDIENMAPSLNLLDSQYVAAVIPTSDGTGAWSGGAYDLAGPSGRFSFHTRPAKRGESVLLYGVGFGPTSPKGPCGKAFSGPAAPVTSHVQVFLGDGQTTFVEAPVAFAGLIGTGLYQINITIPANAPPGDLSVQVKVGGAQTSGNFKVYLPVQ